MYICIQDPQHLYLWWNDPAFTDTRDLSVYEKTSRVLILFFFLSTLGTGR